MKIDDYFLKLDKDLGNSYDIAKIARSKGLDAVNDVEILLAKNLAERVEGLISTVASQIKDSGVVKRIEELEKEFGNPGTVSNMEIHNNVVLNNVNTGINADSTIETVHNIHDNTICGHTRDLDTFRIDNQRRYIYRNNVYQTTNIRSIEASSGVCSLDSISCKKSDGSSGECSPGTVNVQTATCNCV